MFPCGDFVKGTLTHAVRLGHCNFIAAVALARKFDASLCSQHKIFVGLDARFLA
jgi:hypothetical protein